MVPAADGLVDVRSVGVRTQVVVAREDQDVDDALSLPQSSLSTVSASTDVVAVISSEVRLQQSSYVVRIGWSSASSVKKVPRTSVCE